MKTPKTLLACNLSAKTVTSGGNAWEPPAYVFGESLTLALRLQRDANGQAVDEDYDVRSLRAMVGIEDARPESGKWALQVGPGAQTAGNTTALMPHDIAPNALAAAINAKAAVVAAYGTAAAQYLDGSWRIIFGTGAVSVPLRVVDNTLFPVSLGEISSFAIDEVWLHEVRLVQAPAAATTASERVLPPAPTIELTQAGGGSGGYTWNEIQTLKVPPDFAATYIIRYGLSARTSELTVEDGPETIQAALEAVLGANFKVTAGENFAATIEFINDLAESAQPLMTIEALNPPPGDLTFTLDFGEAPMLVRLQRAGAVTLPLEVRIEIAGEDDVVRPYVVIRQDITIKRPIIWPDMAVVPNIDWLRPPSPKDYQAFNPDTVITGQQFFPAVAGDGVATEFVVDHGLDTLLVHVWVHENITNGLQLIEGTDYEVRISGDNSVTVTALGDPPDEEGWLIVVMSAQTVGAFAAGLEIEIDQVTGLQAIIDDLTSRLVTLEEILPGSANGVAITTKPSDIKIPDFKAIWPTTAVLPDQPDFATLRLGALLPAFHVESFLDSDTVLVDGELPDPEPHEGELFLSNGATDIDLPGGGGRRGEVARNSGGDYFGSDGRYWYLCTIADDGASASFYPRSFQRELFMIYVSAAQLRAGGVFGLAFDLKLQAIRATSRVRCLVMIEVGAAPGQVTPTGVGTNLQDVTWLATPLLKQEVVFTGVERTHHFGCTIRRSAGDVMTADRLLYDLVQGGAQAPAGTSWTLRARLVEFDTENSVTNAKGLLSAQMINAECAIQNPS